MVVRTALLAAVACCALGALAAPDVFEQQHSSEVTSPPIQRNASRSFAIDYERDTFLMDGRPFRYVAGSLHYFRSPRRSWPRLLRALRAAGLTAVSTYVEWSYHEPEKGQYKWSGDRDLEHFIRTAQLEGLLVILRPGPYICAERDLGGLPYWLLTKYPRIKLRTSDSDYKAEVAGWYDQLMPRMRPLLYGNGGPIIMVQVENEYGSFPACDGPYLAWLAALTEQWTQGAAQLFTTDGSSRALLRCGSVPGAYATVDFGSGQNLEEAWSAMRAFSPRGPLVNSEYYPGWLTHWGERMASVSTVAVVRTLNDMLAAGANVNFYMFHGGTNFGFTAGANLGSAYQPDITSYDYDAPLTEAGNPTIKYAAIRRAVLQHLPAPPTPVPLPQPTSAFGLLALVPTLALLSREGRELLGEPPRHWALPPTMEAQGQAAGLLLYETTLPARRPDPSQLTVPGLADRALVYLDSDYAGVLSRSRKLTALPLLAQHGDRLTLLVENQGRINFGPLINDFKGITSNVTLNSNVIRNWTVTSFKLESVARELAAAAGSSLLRVGGVEVPTAGLLRAGPVLYEASFVLPEGPIEPLDTYLDVTGWGKGVAYVNDRNLGRYWPGEGPQVTLYVPGAYLLAAPEANHLVLLEMQSAPAVHRVQLVGKPVVVDPAG